MLVIHGDIFDVYSLNCGWIYHLGDRAYGFSMWLNAVYNHIMKKLGFKYWSLSQMLKRSAKKAVNFINNFEYFMVKIHTSKRM
jgi:UDP-2,3-diacylglucosamine pyrophosphatase LpxH